MSQSTAVSARPSAPPPALFCEVWQVPTPLQRQDLTRFGVFVRSSASPGLHSELEVRVVLDAELDVTVQAMVVEVVTSEQAGEGRDAGYAMLFQHVSEEQGQALDRILARVRDDAAPAPNPPEPGAPAASQPQRAPCPLTRELQVQAESWRNAEPHVVLGVRRGASPELVDAAFLDLAQRYHPHRFVRHDSRDVTDAATDLFLVIKAAHGRCSLPPAAKPRRRKRHRSRAISRRTGSSQ